MDHVGGLADLVKRMPVETFIDHGANELAHDKLLPELALGRPTSSFPNIWRPSKHHKQIIAKPGQVIQIAWLTDTIVSSNGAVLTKSAARSRQAQSGLRQRGKQSPPRCGRRGECPLGRLGSDLRKVKIAMFGDLSWQKERELSCPPASWDTSIC